jgi:hypothetical protein
VIAQDVAFISSPVGSDGEEEHPVGVVPVSEAAAVAMAEFWVKVKGDPI